MYLNVQMKPYFQNKDYKWTYAPEKMLGYILVHSIISLRLSNLSLHLHERRQQYTAWIEFSLFVPEDECHWQFCKAIGTVFLKWRTNDSLCAWEKNNNSCTVSPLTSLRGYVNPQRSLQL